MDQRNPIINPMRLLDALDSKLRKSEAFLDLIVLGGFVLQMNYSNAGQRYTGDIDTLTKLTKETENLIREVGEENSFALPGGTLQYANWINNHVRHFDLHEKLPVGWEERARQEKWIYKGENLILYPLSRRDLLLTKLYAILNDGSGRSVDAQAQDAEDFLALSPTHHELASLFPNVRKMLPLWKRYFIGFGDVQIKLHELFGEDCE